MGLHGLLQGELYLLLNNLRNTHGGSAIKAVFSIAVKALDVIRIFFPNLRT
jgi:hypothetical protein